eukprot:PhF_6_TR19510/c0_g1_i1/m.28489
MRAFFKSTFPGLLKSKPAGVSYAFQQQQHHNQQHNPNAKSHSNSMLNRDTHDTDVEDDNKTVVFSNNNTNNANASWEMLFQQQQQQQPAVLSNPSQINDFEYDSITETRVRLWIDDTLMNTCWGASSSLLSRQGGVPEHLSSTPTPAVEWN